MSKINFNIIPKDYRVNVFEKDYLINPSSKNLTKKQQLTCKVAMVALAVFTLGVVLLCVYLNRLIKNKKSLPQAVKRENRTVHVAPQKFWKNYPDSSWGDKDFSYKQPSAQSEFVGTSREEEKEKIEKMGKEKMREAIKVMESAQVDAIRELLENGELTQAVETLNTFCNRVMDVYQAYVEVQIDENIPKIPTAIGVIKSSGFTHNEILELREPCKWYADEVSRFHENLMHIGLEKTDCNTISQYIASKRFIYKTEGLEKEDLSELENSLKELLARFPNYKEEIETLSQDFCNALAQNKKCLNKIKAMDRRITFARSLSQKEKEEMKLELGECDFTTHHLGNDPRSCLIEEIRQRFSWRDFEPGYVGSPLRLLNIVRGKHDEETKDGYFRAKLFFIYGSKNIMNEIARSKEFVTKINAKLKNMGKDWQMDEKLTDTQREKSKTDPIYKLGVYARENNVGNKTRVWASHDQVQEYKQKDPNVTFAEAERIARKENVSPEELKKRFRFPLYREEEMAFFGTNQALEKREQERKNSVLEAMTDPSGGADTSYYESVLDYQKRTTQIPWVPGKHFFTLNGSDVCDSLYLKAVEDLGLPQNSGISGSTDQTFTLAGAVGIQSIEELMDLRLLYIPWMSGHEDHTADEIMTASKSFGLSYTPAPDYYKQIYPSLEAKLTAAIKKAQNERGYELPDYYLSEEYAKQLHEAMQHEKVEELMHSNQLFLHGCRTYRKNYGITDLFGDEKWKSYTKFLTDARIESVNKKRREKRKKAHGSSGRKVRFELNFHERVYQEHAPSNPPIYEGTKKQCVTLVPPKGKVIPYVPFDYPSLNRVGLLFDANSSQLKPEKFVFQYDANTDIEAKWKRTYTKEEMAAPDFQEKVKQDAEEAIKFNREMAHQVSLEELIRSNEEKQDTFVPYNEINASIHNKGIVGVFTFSRGLPTHTDRKVQYEDQREKYDWAPLHHESVVGHTPDEDYDRYMILMGIGKKIATREQFEIDVPLYQMNETTDTGLTLVPRQEQIDLIEQVLTNENGEQSGIVRVIKSQSDIKLPESLIREGLVRQLKSYLKKL